MTAAALPLLDGPEQSLHYERAKRPALLNRLAGPEGGATTPRRAPPSTTPARG